MQLENVGHVALQFNWRVLMDNEASHDDVKGTMSSTVYCETPRPATAGPLIIQHRTDDLRPSSALAAGNNNNFCLPPRKLLLRFILIMVIIIIIIITNRPFLTYCNTETITRAR